MDNSMLEELFGNKDWDEKALEEYGFARRPDGWVWTQTIMQQFELCVRVHDNDVSLAVTEQDSGEEYTLIGVESADGAFVNEMRHQIRQILESIAAKCCVSRRRGGEQLQSVIAYAKQTYGDEIEYLWKDDFDDGVVRRADNRKWYVLLMIIDGGKVGRCKGSRLDVAVLRGAVEEVPQLIERQGYAPAYHMNKKHWFTICLDGTVPDSEIRQRIDDSYRLAAGK